MNKISKKIVALATMAAFVLTLVPAAAFGATVNPESPVDPANSTVQTVKKNVAVNIGDQVEFTVDMAGVADTDKEEVYFWVETPEGDVVNDVDYYGNPNGNVSTSVKWIGNNKVFYTEETTNTSVRALAIKVAGDFVIKAGVNKQDKGTPVDAMSDLTELQNVKDYTNIKVSVPEMKTLTLTGKNSAGTAGTIKEVADGVYTLNLINDAFKANTSDTYTVTGNVKDADNRVIANKEVKIESHDTALWFNGETEENGAVLNTTTDKNGDFTFTFRMNDNRNVPITITIDGKE